MGFQPCPWLNRIITVNFDIKRFHVTSGPPLALVVYQNNKTAAILVPWLPKVSFLFPNSLRPSRDREARGAKTALSASFISLSGTLSNYAHGYFILGISRKDLWSQDTMLVLKTNPVRVETFQGCQPPKCSYIEN